MGNVLREDSNSLESADFASSQDTSNGTALIEISTLRSTKGWTIQMEKVKASPARERAVAKDKMEKEKASPKAKARAKARTARENPNRGTYFHHIFLTCGICVVGVG